MKSKQTLESSDLARIATAAAAEAQRQGWPVAIAIVDDGGHLLHFHRLDGAAPMTAETSIAKARASALGRRDSKGYEDMINQGRTAFLSAPLRHGLLEGAVPLVVDGQCLGAVGVSGVKPGEDAQVARAGAAVLAAG